MSEHVLLSGILPYALKQPNVVHIPVPGSHGLCVQLLPRSGVPARGSAAALFFHYAADDQHLRMDYAYCNRTQAFHYHWQRDCTHAHAVLTERRGRAAVSGTRCYRYRGRALLLVGRALDEIALVQSTASAHAVALEEVVRM